MELLETLRLFSKCCNSDRRLRSRSSLRSRPLPQKKSIPRASFECFQELKTFSPTFHALRGTFISLVWLPALVWMSSLGLNVQPRPSASAGQPSDLGWQLSDLRNKSSSCGMKSWASVFPTPGHSHSCPRELLFFPGCLHMSITLSLLWRPNLVLALIVFFLSNVRLFSALWALTSFLLFSLFSTQLFGQQQLWSCQYDSIV